MKHIFLNAVVGLGLALSAGTPGATGLQLVSKIAPLADAQPPAERDLAAYLFVFFRDEDHSIHFATSTDGYSFTDVNGAGPSCWGRTSPNRKACAIRTSCAGRTTPSTCR